MPLFAQKTGYFAVYWLRVAVYTGVGYNRGKKNGGSMSSFSNLKDGKLINPKLRVDGKPRSVPEIVDEWEENGERFVKYKSGMIRNQTLNQIVKPIDNLFINSETSAELGRWRKEKAQAAIGEELVKRMKNGMGGAKAPAEAVALAAGMLWEELVMNKEMNGRDRLNAWVTIGKYAGVLTDLREKEDVEGVKIEMGKENARLLIEKLTRRRDE